MIFIDASIPKTVADELKKVREDVIFKHDIFLPGTDDSVWLRWVGIEGWLGISHDQHIRTRPGERDAIMRHSVGCFILTYKQDLQKPEIVRMVFDYLPEAEQVELWTEDEARLGLKPVVRRVWAPVGKRPIARTKRGYEWTYLYGFARPESGEVFWLILPTVNTELFSLALAEFAKEVGAGKKKRVLLVVDKAGWHTGGEVEVPEGIHLEFLPSGSPELQPAERLWPLTNEALANRLFEEISEIEGALVERCVELLDQAETIRGLTNYHWWPQTA